MPIQKLSAQNNGWTKREAKISRKNSRDFLNITLVGLESENVVKRHLIKTVLKRAIKSVLKRVLKMVLKMVLNRVVV